MTDDQPPDASIPPSVMTAALAAWRETGEERRLPVIGSSMWPLLRAGDHVLVNPAVDSIRRGHIIVFNTPTGLIVHRVIDIRHDGADMSLIAKGDNRRHYDPVVSSDMVLGIVTQLERGQHVIRLDDKLARTAGYWLWRHVWLPNGLGRRLRRLFPISAATR
jgi:signal peptidase I